MAEGNGKSGGTATADEAARLAGWLRLLAEPGQVVELRALEVSQQYGRAQTVAGFFDDLDAMARAALQLTRQAEGVYFTLNPLDPALKARRANRVATAKTGDQAADKHVLRRRWLLIDCDPVRVSGVSSTEAEKRLGGEATSEIRDWLRTACGWPDPVFADSGNSYHLLYRIDQPRDDDGLVAALLKALAARFDTDTVKVDVSVFNPARICKLYGTWARKGENLPERPHRPSRIVESPTSPWPVQTDQLRELADQAPAADEANGRHTRHPGSNGDSRPRLKVREWLAHFGYAFQTKTRPQGWTAYLLDRCPFNPEHTGKEVAVFQDEHGKMGAKCFHNSCSGKDWKAFKGAIGKPLPEHYDPPYAPAGGQKAASKSTGVAAGGPRFALDIILDYFRTNYQPVFRRGSVIYSATLGREVKAAEACFGAGSSLLQLLENAIEAVAHRDESGKVKRNALPRLFTTWSRSAWADLVQALRDEAEPEEISPAAARDFAEAVAAALKVQATIGITIYQNKEEVTHTRRQQLLQWALSTEGKKPFCRKGFWTQVHGYELWGRMDNDGRKRVALRVELFGPGQAACNYPLGRANQRAFSDLAELYDVGTAVRIGNAQRAVELYEDFLADLSSEAKVGLPRAKPDDTVT
jgi:hypothetical protein